MEHLFYWLIPLLVLTLAIYSWIDRNGLPVVMTFYNPLDLLLRKAEVWITGTVRFESIHGRLNGLMRNQLRPSGAETRLSPGHWSLQAEG